MSRRPLRIGFWGNFGTANWGNECTLQAIVHNARKRVPGAELSCICSEPADTEKRHGIRSFPISYIRRRNAPAPRRLPRPLRVLRRLTAETREWWKTLRIARRTDVVVMTGTGMLTDSSEGPFGLPYDIFKWSVAAKACRRRLVFASVGVEPIVHPLARFFIGTSLRLADYRSYRDKQSKDHLRRIGVPVEEDAVYPDLAFSLPEAMKSRRTNGVAARTKIAVGIYDYRGRGDGGPDDERAYREYLDKIGQFVVWLVQGHYQVRIIIGDLTYDEAVLMDLRKWLEAHGVDRRAAGIEDEPASSVDQVMDQIADADIVVASRFHNVLLALLLGKPVVSISYNVKNDALMAQMGLAEYCQPIATFTVARVIEQLGEVERGSDRLRPAIVERAAAFRSALEGQYDALFRAR